MRRKVKIALFSTLLLSTLSFNVNRVNKPVNTFEIMYQAYNNKIGEKPIKSKNTNLIGNITYDRSVTLKSSYVEPGKTFYEGPLETTNELVTPSTVKNLAFIVDGNVHLEKEILIEKEGLHNVKVSTWFLDGNVKKVSKVLLEDFNFIIKKQENNIIVNKTIFYYDYYSTSDALIKDIENKLLKTKNGNDFSFSLNAKFKDLVHYNFKKAIYGNPKDATIDQEISTYKDFKTHIKIVHSSLQDIKLSLNENSNKDLVIDYSSIINGSYNTSKDTYKDLIKKDGMKNVQDFDKYNIFNGVKIDIQDGTHKETFEGLDIVDEGSPFRRFVITDNYSVDFSYIYDTCLKSDGLIDNKNSGRSGLFLTNDDLTLSLPFELTGENSFRRFDIKKDITIIDYDFTKNLNTTLKVDDLDTRHIDQYDVTGTIDKTLSRLRPYIEIATPMASRLIKDYDGVVETRYKKYLVDTSRPMTYVNDVVVDYKGDVSTDLSFKDKVVVEDKTPPHVIKKYDVLVLDQIDKSSFLENFNEYVRFVDNDEVDLSSIKVELSPTYYDSRVTYADVTVSDVSGNVTKERVDVRLKEYDHRDSISKGWQTFCYNWGEFFRNMFGIE